MGVGPVEVIKQLMRHGVMAAINQVIDYKSAATVASNMGFAPTEAAAPKATDGQAAAAFQEDKAALKPRPAIVTVLGHVDHGKTTLLDAIRQTNVTAREAGGITQHIGAYQVEERDHKITFLDTPGHEAFTAMRARGAKVTDIAVLVVAADDGVMPQTIEAISHARAAGVPIIVAVNKIDKEGANPDRVKQQLTEHGVVIEEYGGDVLCVPVSAKQKTGIDKLLESILLVAEVAELKANPDRSAAGVVIESKLDKSKGPVCTIIVKQGTLHVSDWVVAGDSWGRVKAMLTYDGKRLKQAGPSSPVEVLGLNSVPRAGDQMTATPDEKGARLQAESLRAERQAVNLATARGATLESVTTQISAGVKKELNIILKTDVHGSIDPIRSALEKLSNDRAHLNIVLAGTGSITENDVNLAVASNAIIIGFNSRPEVGARSLAEQQSIEVRFYDIIYRVIEDMQNALTGILEPIYETVVDGHAEVRQVFTLGKQNKIAGVYVKDGKVMRTCQARVVRGGKVIYDTKLASLKHFKQDVREMAAGFECGVLLDGFDDFAVGDVLEFYHSQAKQ